MSDEKIIVELHSKKKGYICDLEIPLGITALELINALNQSIRKENAMEKSYESFLTSENPIALLNGNVELSEYGLHDGTIKMKRILLDFRNRVLAIHTNVQDEVEVMWPDIQKSVLLDYLPKSAYMKGDNFTLDFEENKVYINQSVDFDVEKQKYTVDMFIPAEEFIAEDLELRFHDVLDKLGYAVVQWNEREMDYLNTVEFLAGLKTN